MNPKNLKNSRKTLLKRSKTTKLFILSLLLEFTIEDIRFKKTNKWVKDKKNQQKNKLNNKFLQSKNWQL